MSYDGLRAYVNRRLIEDDALEPGWAIHYPADEALPARADGSRASGWQLLVGDEDAADLQAPHLSWLMDRYPGFGELVRSGARDGWWRRDPETGIYVKDAQTTSATES